jgi:LPS-assembly lipoprotein
MSLPERTHVRPRSIVRTVSVLAILASTALGAACTVRPLYSDSGGATVGYAAGAAEGLKQISIAPVNTRFAQRLRNDLIFLLNGGAGQPAQPKYLMALTVTEQVINEAIVTVENDENRPTAATLYMTGSYVLTDAATGKPVAAGKRTIPASYDQPSQEFATWRARIDAENRAARELAELLKLDIGQRLAKL